MNKQEARGKANQVKGRAKEVAGIVTGDKKMEDAGSRLRAEGNVQENVGAARRKVGDAVAKVAKKIKD